MKKRNPLRLDQLRYPERENLLAQSRIEEGLTQKDLAEKCGTTALMIGMLENGKISPFKYDRILGLITKEWVEKAAKVLGTDIYYLFPREACELDKKKLTDIQILNILNSEIVTNQEELFFAKRERDRLFKHLNAREKKIIEMRVGVGCERMTLDEIGKEWAISNQMVRIVLWNAIEKIIIASDNPKKFAKELPYIDGLKKNREYLMSKRKRLLVKLAEE